MSKVLIISDTHGNYDMLNSVLKNNQDCKYLIHLGDEPDDLDRHAKLLLNMQVFSVYGMYHPKITNENMRKCFQIEDVEFAISHCKEYLQIEKQKCIYCYGHTHRSFYDNKDGVVVLNPGHLKDEMDRGEVAGYVVVNIAEKIEVVFYTFDGNVSYTKVVSW